MDKERKLTESQERVLDALVEIESKGQIPT